MVFLDVVKVTETEWIKDLSGLAEGDNLEIEGRREIVNYLEVHKGLHAITTMKIDSGLQDLYIKQRYLASTEMLQTGELVSIGRSDYNISKSNVEFYESNLVRQQPQGATA